METKLRKMRIMHIRKNADAVMLTDWKGNSIEIPELKTCLDRCPSNLLLVIKPVVFTITYAASTSIAIEVKAGKTLVYRIPQKELSYLNRLFDAHSEIEAEIELSLQYYDNKDTLLWYNLNRQTKDVFKFREEILLRYYRDEIPHLVARIKIENNLINALTSSWHNCSNPRTAKKVLFREYLSRYAKLFERYPNFEKWCLQEMEELDKLYRKDKRNKCHSDLSKLLLSQVVKHSSPLIPVNISDERIQEYINSKV